MIMICITLQSYGSYPGTIKNVTGRRNRIALAEKLATIPGVSVDRLRRGTQIEFDLDEDAFLKVHPWRNHDLNETGNTCAGLIKNFITEIYGKDTPTRKRITHDTRSGAAQIWGDDWEREVSLSAFERDLLD